MKLHHRHDPESIKERLSSKAAPSYLRDFIYGSIDGIVTTFAIIAGVVGAGLSNQTIIILGFANVLADGFSMAASNYLGTKAEADEQRKIHSFELDAIKNYPEGEREEIRHIFRAKGFEGEELDRIVSVISQNEEEWLKIMMQEEYGIGTTTRNAFHSGLSTFIAFVVFGILPLTPFLFKTGTQFTYSAIIAGASFFFVGAYKSKWSMESSWSSGLKTFAIGAAASLIAYYTGKLLEGFAV